MMRATSAHERIAMRNIALVLTFLLALALACSAAQQQLEQRLLTMTADECVRIAQANGRGDIALACGIAESAVPIVASAIVPASCELPAADAGAQ